MEMLFLKLLNMSIAASCLIIVVLILRVLLRRTPRWIFCALWGMVALRLICPFSIESTLSLIPNAETIRVQRMENTDGSYALELHSGMQTNNSNANPALVTTAINRGNDGEILSAHRTVENYVAPLLLRLGSVIWILGLNGMLACGFWGFIRLKKMLREAVPIKENIWVCDTVSSPFILGIVKPRIYLPSGMNEQQMEVVIAHEKVHLRYFDYIWKPAGYLLLTIYWFNPFSWAAYHFFCKDIELACDERVISELPLAGKKEYCQVLLECSAEHKTVMAYPLAFGEIGIKERVKKVLNYKKPGLWAIFVALVVCILVVVCFLTNPKGGEENFAGTNQQSAEEVNAGEQTTIPLADTSLPTLHEVMEKILDTVPLEEAAWADVSRVEEYEKPLYLLDSTEDGVYTLYGFYSDEYSYSGLMINVKKNGEEYQTYLDDDYTYGAWMGYENPELLEAADGNVYLSTCWGRGTGVHVDKLFCLQLQDTGEVSCFELTEEMIREQTEKLVKLQLNQKGQEVQVFSIEDGTENFFAVLPYTYWLNGDTNSVLDVALNFGDIQFITDPCMVIISVALRMQDSVIPVYAGTLAFQFDTEVSATGVQFTLHDVSTYAEMGIEELEEAEKEKTVSLQAFSISRSAKVIDRLSWGEEIEGTKQSERNELAFAEDCTYYINRNTTALNYAKVEFSEFADAVTEAVNNENLTVHYTGLQILVRLDEQGNVSEAYIPDGNIAYGFRYSEPVYDSAGTYEWNLSEENSVEKNYSLTRTVKSDTAGSGEEETIEIYTGNVGDGDSGMVLVKDSTGQVLWADSAHAARAGWNNIYLVKGEQEDYLMSVHIENRDSYGEYSYHVYRIAEQKSVTQISGGTYEFGDGYLYDDILFHNWCDTMDDYLEQAELLLSTQEGELVTARDGDADAYNYENLKP